MRAFMEWLLWALAIYFVPVLIAMVSIAALVLWEDQYAYSGGKTLEIKVFTADPGPATAAEAWHLVDAARPLTHFKTQRSEAPVWFAFSAPLPPEGAGIVEFPSRHAVDMTCWDKVEFATAAGRVIAQPGGWRLGAGQGRFCPAT
jgi:hypothetical protein